jgi:hypothetical protein
MILGFSCAARLSDFPSPVSLELFDIRQQATGYWLLATDVPFRSEVMVQGK